MLRIRIVIGEVGRDQCRKQARRMRRPLAFRSCVVGGGDVAARQGTPPRLPASDGSLFVAAGYPQLS
jgi:hypothetical protein